MAKQQRLLVYCAVGERSTLAVEIAQEQGLKDIAHIPGGFRAWQSIGGPIDKID